MPRIYAATSDTEGYYRAMGAAEYPYVLTSFAYPESPNRLQHTPEAMLTDSGAFTVWQLGRSIDLADYINWCNERRRGGPSDLVHISLDVIPGVRGKAPTARQRKRAMDESLANGDALRAAGLPIMEVYHQYEPVDYLDLLLARMAPGDLLGVSPRQGGGPSMYARLRFCEGVFAHLIARFGKALPKVHGLGLTSKPAVFRFPWWSVDSLSWVNPGIWGRRQTRNGTERRDPYLRGRPHYREERCREVLEIWQGWNQDLESLWERRGVTWRK